MGLVAGFGAPRVAPKKLKDKRSGPLSYGPARQTVLSVYAVFCIEVNWTAISPKPLPW
jgi:hypothetical protein